MYKRILTSLAGCAVAALAVVPLATAREVAPPLGPGMVSTLPAPAAQMLKLGEIGAWAVPSKSSPSQAQQPNTREKLGEIGAWAVPTSTPNELGSNQPVSSSGNGFDWNDAGIGAALAFGALLIGAGSLLTIRRHHRPLAH